jgi:hypothetical protein
VRHAAGGDRDYNDYGLQILLVSRTFSDNNAAITKKKEKWKEELF